MRFLLLLAVLPPAAPIFWALVGWLLSLRWRRTGQGLMVLSLVAAWLLSCDFVVGRLSHAMAQPLLSQELRQRTSLWAGQPDAVVLVLGAGVRDGLHADGGHDLKPLTLERLRRGLWWSRELRLPLAFSGGISPRAAAGTPAEAQVVARVLAEEFGTQARWLEADSVDTRDNARRSAPLLRAAGVKHLLLVTHGVHMPRALAHFRAELPEIEIVPAGILQEARPGWKLADWIPNAEAAAQGRYLVYEIVARWVGH